MKRRGFFKSLIGTAVASKAVSNLPKPVEVIKVAKTIFEVPKIPLKYQNLPMSAPVYMANFRIGKAMTSASAGQIVNVKIN